MKRGIFITGTDTDIGKTYVTGEIAKAMKGKNVCYFKAALSGAERMDGKLVGGDAKYVMEQGQMEGDPNDFVTYIFEEALSPHLAARRAGVTIEMEKIRSHFHSLQINYDYILMEGSGGIVCPISDEGLMLYDIVKELGLSVILVSQSGLGAINACVLTCSFLEKLGIECAGIILNRFQSHDIIHQDNLQTIEKLTGKKVLATLAEDGELHYLNTEIGDFWRELK